MVVRFVEHNKAHVKAGKGEEDKRILFEFFGECLMEKSFNQPIEQLGLTSARCQLEKQEIIEERLFYDAIEMMKQIGLM